MKEKIDLPKVKNIYRDRSVIKIKKGLRIYSSKKVVLSEQEKQDYEKRIQKQVEKYERDLKYDFVGDTMNSFNSIARIS